MAPRFELRGEGAHHGERHCIEGHRAIERDNAGNTAPVEPDSGIAHLAAPSNFFGDYTRQSIKCSPDAVKCLVNVVEFSRHQRKALIHLALQSDNSALQTAELALQPINLAVETLRVLAQREDFTVQLSHERQKESELTFALAHTAFEVLDPLLQGLQGGHDDLLPAASRQTRNGAKVYRAAITADAASLQHSRAVREHATQHVTTRTVWVNAYALTSWRWNAT
jgi:hypothetical protein